MPTDKTGPMPGDGFEIGSLLYALVGAADWQACCDELSRWLPQAFPAIRLDIYVPAPEQGLSRVFSTHSPWPDAAAIDGGERALRAWYARSAYFWLIQPLEAAGQVWGWLVLARRHARLEAGAQVAAGQLAPMLALRLRDEQVQQSLTQSLQHNAQLERRLRTNDTLMLQATLVAGTVHDLGNLFTSLLAHSELLLQAAPEELQKDVATMLRAAQDGRHLLRRLQNRSMQLEPDTTSVAEPATAIREALELTRPLWDTNRNITVAMSLPKVPLVRMRSADLREVLVNLILNAIAAMSGGGEMMLACTAEDGTVTISVADTGSGIPYEQQQQIFQPLATTRAQGSGLGLSISRVLLELCGGSIWLKSDPGRGATFFITLPAVPLDRAVSEG